MGRTTITLYDETKRDLQRLKRNDETWDQLIYRLTSEYREND